MVLTPGFHVGVFCRRKVQTKPGGDYEVHWKDHWYDEVKNKAAELADAKFDVIWLPPPSNGEGAGYHPHELYNFNNNYGNETSQKAALKALLDERHRANRHRCSVISHTQRNERLVDLHEPRLAGKLHLFVLHLEFWSSTIRRNSLSDKDKATRVKNERGGPDYTSSDFTRWELHCWITPIRKCARKSRNTLRRYKNSAIGGGATTWSKDTRRHSRPNMTLTRRPSFAVAEFQDGNAQEYPTGSTKLSRLVQRWHPAAKVLVQLSDICQGSIYCAI